MLLANFLLTAGKIIAVIGAAKMCDVGRHLSDREIVHPFVKQDMGWNLHLCGFDVMPENVLCCVWDASKEDAFLGVGANFWQCDALEDEPRHGSQKFLCFGEVFLFSSCKCDWSFQLRWFWEGI